MAAVMPPAMIMRFMRTLNCSKSVLYSTLMMGTPIQFMTMRLKAVMATIAPNTAIMMMLNVRRPSGFSQAAARRSRSGL